ncbi:hypothetical protein I656_01272 [Geobacillus sp. WSUCF1]|nr:hypothetical protein I656_01272 [Geobacillus sp. WSUCF1]
MLVYSATKLKPAFFTKFLNDFVDMMKNSIL